MGDLPKPEGGPDNIAGAQGIRTACGDAGTSVCWKPFSCQCNLVQFVTQKSFLVLWQKGSLLLAQVAQPGCHCAASGEAGRGVTLPRPNAACPSRR